MAVNVNDIGTGMDVYGSDGVKIGSVKEIKAEANTGDTDTDTETDSSHSGGGEGVLGDEDRVDTSYGRGGRGTLGDESRVPGGSGAGGGAGVLGDDSIAGSGSSASRDDETENATTERSYGPRSSTGNVASTNYDVSGTPLAVAESDTVMVEGVQRSPDLYSPSGLSAGSDSDDDYGGAASTPSVVAGSDFFEVDHGGIFGIGAKAMYVPYSAVQQVLPGDRVVLSCTKDECMNLYGDASQ